MIVFEFFDTGSKLTKQAHLKNLRRKIRNPFIRALIGILAKLSFKWNQKVGNFIGILLYRYSKDLRRTTEINLQRCFPEKNDQERAAICKHSMLESGKTLTEMAPMWLWPLDKTLALLSQVEGEDKLQRAYAQGRGVILLSPHLGCWEIISLYAAEKYPMTNMFRPHRIKSLSQYMEQGRQRGNATLVPTDMSGVKELMRALRRGEIAGLLPDQDPGAKGGEFADFFGVPANTMTLVARLACKTKAPVLFAIAERLPGAKGYKLVFTETNERIASCNELESITEMNQAVQDLIVQNPNQYQWSYRRFKSRPGNEKKFYN